MIEKIIDFSVKNRFVILMLTLFMVIASVAAIRHTPLDALPDLSPPQVIVQIKWQGQSPKLIDEQGTYPLVTQFLSISDIATVRAFSTYENALIYIIFKDGTDLYWARSRVLEQLASVQSKLPKDMEVSLGPDASGVGWAYEYALRSKKYDLAQLRSLQDYYFKYGLMGIDGVSEVASVGGFVPTFQVTIDNDILTMHRLGIDDIVKTLQRNNNDTGGRIVVKNGFEWMVQARGYLRSLDEIASLTVRSKDGIPLKLGDIARIERVPAPRRGLAELNGKGETVGGIVIVRYGADLYRTIKKIKKRLGELHIDGVEIVPVYDRSKLIEASTDTLKRTLLEESVIVIAVIALFLLHLRSSLVMIVVLPLTIMLPFLLMKLFGIGSNIMSLGGIAIAVGAMVDASIVMIENAHKALLQHKVQKGAAQDAAERIEAIVSASKTVGRPIFFALALVVVSFLPIFALSGQEGLLFTPLAFTKTFAMTAGALLSVTLVPVLMIYFLKGKLIAEEKNPINRVLIFLYRPLLVLALKLRYLVLIGAVLFLALTLPFYRALDWEFMPMLDEGDVMYMPVTPYGISIDQSKQLLQESDAILKRFPEVKSVFGKAGRADTATDPAPLGMLETIITFKPKSQWRAGMSKEKLLKQMDAALRFPGLVNSWTYPIRGRIDMLISGIRTPLGIKLFGDDPAKMQAVAEKIEGKLRELNITRSVFADRSDTGYYLDIDLNETAMAHYGIDKAGMEHYIATALGGKRIGTFYKGLERYGIAVRFEEKDRSSLDAIGAIRVKTARGFQPLRKFATLRFVQGPSVIKSESAQPVTFIYITPDPGVSAVSYKEKAKAHLASLKLPPGYHIEWAGQAEYLHSALKKMVWIVPTVLLLILLLIYLALKDLVPTLIVFATLPFALTGGVIYLYWLKYHMSVAVIVGFLALLGIAAETAIVMIVYLKERVAHYRKEGRLDMPHLKQAIYEGAVLRVRPKMMTVSAILAGLLPIMHGTGVGSEVMQRIAAPMIGGVISSAVLSLVVIPLLYFIYEKRRVGA